LVIVLKKINGIKSEMKRLWLLAGICTVLFCSCESKTGTGVLVGGALGAGTGAIIGGGEGALIGGAVGVIAGGLVGAALDAQDRKIMQQKSPQTLQKLDRGDHLSIDDVKEMSKNGLSDSVIISQIEATGTRFELSPEEIIDLKNSGVSQKVINYMIQTGK
jgi:outer membrane lipoprotein SlyB